jgi:aminoglycoside phosphotransferase (APT) family kinase protein
MPGTRMHADEVDIDEALVARLVAAQFPRWAGLPVLPVRSAGTDNAMYRLGEELAVRLPRIPGAVGQVAKEQHWLPRLAPQLPLAVPQPVGAGVPGEGFPFPWSVYRWLDGANLIDRPLGESREAAVALGRFVAALRRIDPSGGPRSFRGGPLHELDADVRAGIRALGADGTLDPAAATAAWAAVLRLPRWQGAPTWLHGDLLPGNLLATGGRLSAVIDFGGLGIGDPAADCLAAWAVLPAENRGPFREAAELDDATWARGRGWALAFGLLAAPYYRDTNPVLAGIGRHAVAQALADTGL